MNTMLEQYKQMSSALNQMTSSSSGSSSTNTVV
jgi:hypothetical protein